MKRFKLFFVLILLLSSCGKEEMIALEDVEKETYVYSLSELSDYANDTLLIIRMSSFKLYMILEHTSSTTFQGNTVYGDMLFQSHHSNDLMDVYNLKTKTFLYSIDSEPIETTHNNNVDFGIDKYYPDDEFPLIYLEGRGNTHHTDVYRIVNDAGIYSMQHVQNINFLPTSWSTTTNNLSDGTMCIYHGENGDKVYSIINIPDYKSDTLNYIINSNSRNKVLSCVITQTGQDAAIYDNCIFHLSGFAESGCLDITNLSTHYHFERFLLPEAGLVREPEGICFWNDNLLITDSAGYVYIAKIKIDHRLNQ